MDVANVVERTPKVSIGLPVYNGEAYLGAAIRSIIDQTFEDWELIICDNASTDGTMAICEKFAANDDRIHYHRNTVNIGAAPNFNKAFEMARGTYFKWAAHDDLCHPEFLQQCVDILERDPESVLAYPLAQIIDADGKLQEVYTEEQPTHDADPVIRFRGLTGSHRCFQVFGLIRRSTLQNTPLIGSFARSDAILLCWLGIRGRFSKINNVLFFPRRHQAQSMAMLADKKRKKAADYIAYSEWFDPRLRNKMVFPWWRSWLELTRCVVRCCTWFSREIPEPGKRQWQGYWERPLQGWGCFPRDT